MIAEMMCALVDDAKAEMLRMRLENAQLQAEVKRLHAANAAAFLAMCAHRDTPDDEWFRAAIDDLGAAMELEP